MRHIAGFFKSLRPVFTFNSLTGAPEVSFDLKPEESQTGLIEIFNYLKSGEKHCYIAIDEFQQVMEYPEKGGRVIVTLACRKAIFNSSLVGQSPKQSRNKKASRSSFPACLPSKKSEY